ncbi:Receptor-like protein kinase 7 [Linum grandiflorum]
MPSITTVFFLFCFLFFSSPVHSDDLQLLLTFKSSFQNPNPPVFDSWTTSLNSPCNFTGITCSRNSVTEINLSASNLQGSLPLDSICQLNSLEKLSLSWNSLTGVIPKELNNCTNLRYLDLRSNFFTGQFPDISALSLLQHLYLNQSGISGVFPWKSLANIKGLITLSLGDNSFDPAPFPIEILQLTNLQSIYLSNTSLQGTIPEAIGGLTDLISLELSENQLTGEIPSSIGNLKNLWQLELYDNNLTGEFPPGIRNLTRLENFDASKNHLRGNLSYVGYLTNLVTLQLFQNELSGEIPPEFGQFQKLVNLSLYENQLTGPLPRDIGSVSNFDYIDVSENFLTGPIPPNMCNRGTMRGVLMLQNNFSGGIPASYADCKTLLRFRVSKNSLSGQVPPGIWGLPNVNIIDIENNQLEGPLTSDIGEAKSLGQLFVSNNRLSGDLPEEISQAKSLVSISLSGNQFSGKIPESIGGLKLLSSLQMQINELSGPIPESLGLCNSLSDINMAQNSLSGQIPSSLGSLPTLNSLNLTDNKLSGGIPATLSSLKLSLLDLSNNRLTGIIPVSLSIDAYNGSFDGNPGLCSETVNGFKRCRPVSGMSKDIRTLLTCLAVGSLILLVSFGCYLHLKNRETEQDHGGDRSLKGENWDVKSFHVLTFSEDDIVESIKQENIIGKGGSGSVYKATLANGRDVAVKHIWTAAATQDGGGKKHQHRSTTPMLGKRGGGGGRKSKELDAEVQTLSSIRHVNVVKLYCCITSEDSSLLVYEYMSNGSLWDRLHASQKVELDWDTRYEIAVGAAKGLEYLHHGCERPVIHRDVKSSNILLDEFFKPRIADFGLAKIVQSSSGKDSTRVIAGTHGYIAPEYAYTYKVDEKSDVYSFGVVLMELVSGKRPMEPEFGENKDIVDWISSKLKTKESVFSIVDSRIPDVYKEDTIKVLRIAILCTAKLPNLRPTMRSVVQMLEEAKPCQLLGIFISKDDKKNSSDRKSTTEH